MRDSKPPDRESDVPGAQALLRGLDVLMAIGMSPKPLRFRDIQEAVQLPRGTLHRLLAALQQRQIIRIDDRTRCYHVGSRVFELARRTIDQSSLIRATKPEIVRLARELGRPVCLYLPDGNDLFVIDFEDPDAAQSRMIRIWPRVAMADSAAGIAMLASLRPEERQGVLGTLALSTDLGMSQALGYAVVTSQEPVQLAAVAAAVCDESGYPIAAICCTLEAGYNGAEQLHEIGRLVGDGARRASGNYPAISRPAHVLPTPRFPPSRPVVSLDTGRDYMGENPIWVPEQQQIVWLDILAPALRILDVPSKVARRIVLPEITGGLALDTKGRVVLLGQHGVSRFTVETGQQSLLVQPESDRFDNRFNSASVASDGALWAGTMALNNTPGMGHLYRIGPDFDVTRTEAKLGLPKNAAWSPDDRTLYIGDGATGNLLAYDCDLGAGRLSNPRTFVSGSAETGVPNGIAVDQEGCIWAAMYGGWAINRYHPDGRLIESVSLPVPMPVNLCFGGRNLRTLFITTSYLRLPPGFSTSAPTSGNLFKVEVDVPGLPRRKFGHEG